MKIKVIFKWYDFWVGLFWDKKKRILYLFPIPMLGIEIIFPLKCDGTGLNCAYIKRFPEDKYACCDWCRITGKVIDDGLDLHIEEGPFT